MGLSIDSPILPKTRRGILHELKRKLRDSCSEDDNDEHRYPLRKISNRMPADATDCLLAPPFPGDIALFPVVASASSTTPSDIERRRQNSVNGSSSKEKDRPQHPPKASATRPSRKRGGRRKGQSAVTRAGGGRAESLIVVSQALLAIGPGVTVSRLRSPGGGGGGGSGKSGQEPGTMATSRSQSVAAASRFIGGGSLSICTGDGPVAIAGCGQLKRLRLKSGQRRAIDSSRVVGWTSGVTSSVSPAAGRSKGGGANSNAGAGLGPCDITDFKGPGFVFVQTHSIAGLRRLFSRPHVPPLQSRTTGLGQRRGAEGQVASPGAADVALSLKKGLAKRVKARAIAGARRVLLAAAFFALYVAVYSVFTALLLEGREGLVKAPSHALQVVRSLAKVARRVALVLVRLGQEELWRTEGDGSSQGSRDVSPEFYGTTSTEP
ncbi:unnamed protein product [Sphacelaria rigidula]